MKPLDEMTLNERVKLYAEGDPENGIHCHSFDFTKEDEENIMSALRIVWLLSREDFVHDFQNERKDIVEDDSFHLAVFDPPHLQWAGDTSIMALKYGKLKGDWKSMLTAGFNECMRVLRPNGVLIFKWSEIQFPLSEILPLFPQQPLFGNRMIKRGNKTHWLCFMKDEVSE